MTMYCVVAVLFSLLYLCFGKENSVINNEDKFKYNGCHDVLRSNRYSESGIYTVFPNRSEPLQVYCRFESGSASVSIMQQKFGSVNFMRGWNDYEYGFGSFQSGDFWMGLRDIKYYTDAGYHILTVTLQDWSHVIKTIQYNYFVLGAASQRYPLSIRNYVSSGVLPDDLSHSNKMPFSTIDRPDVHQCARNQKAGWWYNYCSYALPTGHYYLSGPYVPSGYFDGIYYSDWHGFNYSLKYIRMDLTHF